MAKVKDTIPAFRHIPIPASLHVAIPTSPHPASPHPLIPPSLGIKALPKAINSPQKA